MTVKSSANSVILILFAISDNLSAENSKLSADSWNRGNHLLGCMPGSSLDACDRDYNLEPWSQLDQWCSGGVPQKKASLCSSRELRDTNDPGPLMKPHNTLQKGPNPVCITKFENATYWTMVFIGSRGLCWVKSDAYLLGKWIKVDI